MPARSQRHMTQMGRVTSGGVQPINLGIYFTGWQAPETVALNAALGTLSTQGTTGTAVFSLTNSDGNRVALTGTNNVNVVRGATAWDFETKPLVTFTVSVTGVTPAIAPTSFQMICSNVLETVLNALTLSANTVAEGAPLNTVVGAIQNRTAGSTLTLTSGNAYFAISGTNLVTTSIPTDYEAATSHSVTIRETHPDAAPRDTSFTINVTNVLEGNLTALTLSNNSINENVATGTTVGTLQGKTIGSTLALTDNAGGKFTLSGTDVVTAAALDYETATTHNITVRETLVDASNSPRDTILAISVSDVSDTITLAALTLSTNTVLETATIGATVGAVLGKTASSTLLLTDTAGGKFALSGTNVVTAATLDYETATSHSITIRETLAGATNTPRDTILTINVGDVAEGGSDTTPNAFSFPPQNNVAVSTPITSAPITVSGIDAPSPLTITGGQYSINSGALASAATTVVNGNTVAVQVMSSASNLTPASTTLTIGGVNGVFTVTTIAAAPTITSNPTQTIPENAPFALDLTASEAGTWAITGGADMALFALSGDGLDAVDTFNFEAPEDANTDNVYQVQVTFTSSATGLTATQMISLTVTNVADTDTTAPFLTAATGVKTGATTATLTVTTDEANGTLYGSASAAAPTKAQIKAGQTSTGAASSYAFNQAVAATGVQTRNATGLTASTSYTMHYMHEDVAGNQSNVASATSFTTDAAGGYVEIDGTNLISNPRDVTNASWTKGVNISAVTADTTLGPDGTTTADTVLSLTGNFGACSISATYNATTGAHSFGVDLKYLGFPWIAIDVYDMSYNNVRNWFNIQTGTVGASQYGTPSIVALPNGFYRLIVENYTTVVEASSLLLIRPVQNNNDGSNVAGDNTKGFIHAQTFLKKSATIIGVGGDTAPPVISTSATQSVNENLALAVALTANEAVTWAITGGADAAKFEISGTTLRWAGNGTKDFETKDDANADSFYVVQVTATDPSSNATNKTITVEVLDLSEGGGYTPITGTNRVPNQTFTTWTGSVALPGGGTANKLGPDGSTNVAVRFTAVDETFGPAIVDSPSFTAQAPAASIAVELKPNADEWISVGTYDDTFAFVRSWFHVGIATPVVGTVQKGTASIVALPNGYVRLIIENIPMATAGGENIRLHIVATDGATAAPGTGNEPTWSFDLFAVWFKTGATIGA